MLLRKERKIIIVTGKSGTGKTKLSRQILALFSRKIILDIMEEYECKNTYNNFQEFLNAVSILDQNIDVCIRGFKDSDVNYICEWCLLAGNILLGIEEFESYVSRYDAYPQLDEIIRRGRHNDVSLLAVSQRVPDFPPLFRSQITSFFSFYQDEPIDVKHLLDRDFNIEDIENLKRCEGLDLPVENLNYLRKGDSMQELKDWNARKQDHIVQSEAENFSL